MKFRLASADKSRVLPTGLEVAVVSVNAAKDLMTRRGDKQ